MHLIEDTQSGLGAQSACPRTDGVEHNGLPQRPRTLSRREHARDGTRIECADVEAEPCAECGDLLHLLRIVRHDGACPDGKQDVRNVVDGDVVGDAMDERGCRADLVEG